MNQPFKTGWYVFYVRSCQEKKISTKLKEQRHEVFLPLIKSIRQWSDRKKTITQPLFPSYVFVYVDSPMRFHRVLSTEGICTCVRFGKEYAIVTDSEVNKVKLLIGAKDISDIETNIELPKVGEIRQISYGSFNGIDCEVLKIKNTHKVVVRIDSLQQNIVATIPSYYLSDVLHEAC